MNIYKLISISSIIFILLGCSTNLPEEETHSKKEEKAIQKGPILLGTALLKDQIEETRAYEVDEQITSAIGESKTHFTTHGVLKTKVSIVNTGTNLVEGEELPHDIAFSVKVVFVEYM
ncbi:hypothetical protein I6G82_01185 [Lysinibacillus macroides]|uniref:Lipoprotein n=1 Tax=Lysinibacillus macroides TaxID=33935 RepID=A0A0N0UWU7_9BACI|nr:hypothetical protein [Lysinibacillus macroides]KOY82104.1 hypothetical protein ADM90_10680 [Lysinibacillus macroides]QPR68317.1 hypothetical protein I6G82_01185 [Lysinibacillus macroides]